MHQNNRYRGIFQKNFIDKPNSLFSDVTRQHYAQMITSTVEQLNFLGHLPEEILVEIFKQYWIQEFQRSQNALDTLLQDVGEYVMTITDSSKNAFIMQLQHIAYSIHDGFRMTLKGIFKAQANAIKLGEGYSSSHFGALAINADTGAIIFDTLDWFAASANSIKGKAYQRFLKLSNEVPTHAPPAELMDYINGVDDKALFLL